MLTGQSFDHVVNLDVLTFNAMCKTLNRVHYRDLLRDAWLGAAACSVGMSGNTKALDQIAEDWEEVTESKKQKNRPVAYDAKKAVKGQQGFLSALMGGGMKGGKF